MPTIRFTDDEWPESVGEFRRTLQEAQCVTASIDDFVQLVRDLTLLEQKHRMRSAEFYERYQRGEMGDEIEFMRWATKFEIYEEMEGDDVVSAPAPDLSEVLREIDAHLYLDTSA